MIYVVKENDTVDSISEITGDSVQSILYNNQISYPYELAIGQALFITSEQTEKRNIQVSGFAYPFISREVLIETLPYLTRLCIFSYGFTETGELLAPPLPDEWMIELAVGYQTLPILTLTPLGPDGRFNNQLISAVVQNEEVSDRLLNELTEVMQEKGYRGLDIDFEYVKAEDRDSFTEFVRKMTESLNMLSYVVSVDLAPKNSSDQEGLLYEGKDYGGLGSVANQVLVMTYEWGYTYGPPMAVAPIGPVERVIEYSVTQIPVSKLTMGIPNYGYDWKLPYERGVTKARSIGNIEAVRIAIDYGVPILYDEEAQSPYILYEEDGVSHEVWFEDVRSMNAKFDLMEEYQLAGCGYWQIMNLFRANWLLLKSRFQIIKD